MKRVGIVTFLLLAALALGIFLTGDFWSPGRSNPAVSESVTKTGVRGLIVEPNDGRQPILSEIAAARDSIDILIYIINDEQIVDALLAAEKRGVEVRLIIEEHPYGGFGNPEEVASKLRAAGAEVRWSSSSFTFTHAKTMLFDRAAVAILNLNLTRSGFEDNREFGIISTWPSDVALAQAIFDADWTGERIVVNRTLVVSPKNSRDEMLGLIDSATSSILVYAEVIRDREVVEQLVDAEDKGIQVQILLSPDNDPRWIAITGELISAGIEIRESKDLYIHAKAIVIDNRRAYVGSQNFTQTSLDENREIGIVISEADLVARLVAVFGSDFAASLPLS